MNVYKNLLKTKLSKIGLLAIIVIILLVCGYFIYENNRKNEILSKMSITFTDKTEIEYGTKDFDVKKELVKEVKDAELTDVPKIDTMKIGESKLVFTLHKDDVTKEVEHTIKIVDTKGPEISLETDSKELTVGDEYDIKTNIKNVADVVDGAIALVEDAKSINEKATEEYSKLKKEEITDETKVADKKSDEFFIETIKDEESGEEITKLYLKNCYYIDGSVDVQTVGEYKISVVAVDKNGIKTTSEFTVTVKEKEVEQPVASTNGGVYSSGGGYTSSGSGGSSSGSNGGGSSVARGSKSDIVNTALAQIGKPYQVGASGPNAFDCSGLIYYAYTQNGWSIPRYPESGGTRITYDQLQAGDILYQPDNGAGGSHVAIFTGEKDVFIQSANNQVGYFMMYYGVKPDWQFIRY